MPLLDHFHDPVSDIEEWEAIHASWAVDIAGVLNKRLPPRFRASPLTRAGGVVEIDVATLEQEPSSSSAASANGGTATALAARTWAPPAPACSMPSMLPADFEIRIFSTRSGTVLVGAIELVSPSNKDRPDSRHAFATKCASYLYQGVSVIILDVVTDRHFNLHNEIMTLMQGPANTRFTDDVKLYAVAYRPVLRGQREEIDLWPTQLILGQPLPTLPLRLTGDLFVPVDFEQAYAETCKRLRIV